MSTSPKRPTLPEGADPMAALRRLQQQLASARLARLVPECVL